MMETTPPNGYAWRIVHTGIGSHLHLGSIGVDGSGALVGYNDDGSVDFVFGPGMWVRVESERVDG